MKRHLLKLKASLPGMLITYCVRRLKEFIFLADFDPVQFFSGVVSIGCGWVLQLDPQYMESSTRLHNLLDRAPQLFWMYLLFVGGGAQMFVFLLSGCPGFFCKSHASVHDHIIRWYIGTIVVELGGVGMYGMLAVLLSFDGPSWATVLFGTTALGCFWASVRVGALIGAEQEYKRQREIYEFSKATRPSPEVKAKKELAEYLHQHRPPSSVEKTG